MKKITGAYIELTDSCNANCPYCYNKPIINAGDFLSPEQLEPVISGLSEYGVRMIALSGGEPFLHDDIGATLGLIHTHRMQAHVISNGTCFLPRNYSILLKHTPELQITFDGCDSASHDATRGAGNFEQIISGIKHLDADGYPGKIVPRVNVFRGNIHNITRILDTLTAALEPLNTTPIEGISLSIVSNTGKVKFAGSLTADEYLSESVLSELHRWNSSHTKQAIYTFHEIDVGCPYNSDEDSVECGFRIAPNGDVFPCQMFSDAEFCIGNIKDTELREILNGAKLTNFIGQVHARKKNTPQCGDCFYRIMCSGGCPATAYSENNTIFSVSSKCLYRRKKMEMKLFEILLSAKEKQDSSIQQTTNG